VGVGKRAIAKDWKKSYLPIYSNVYYLGIANIDQGWMLILVSAGIIWKNVSAD